MGPRPTLTRLLATAAAVSLLACALNPAAAADLSITVATVAHPDRNWAVKVDLALLMGAQVGLYTLAAPTADLAVVVAQVLSLEGAVAAILAAVAAILAALHRKTAQAEVDHILSPMLL